MDPDQYQEGTEVLQHRALKTKHKIQVIGEKEGMLMLKSSGFSRRSLPGKGLPGPVSRVCLILSGRLMYLREQTDEIWASVASGFRPLGSFVVPLRTSRSTML
jgi:hypothetical protein